MSAETSFNRASYLKLPNIMLGKPKPTVKKAVTTRQKYYKVFLKGEPTPLRVYDKQSLNRIVAANPGCVVRLVSPQN